MKQVILLTSLLAFAVGCSKTDSTQFKGRQAADIINGQPALDNPMAASVVGLFVKYTGSGFHGVWLQWCTGSVISPKLILTAAHCVEGVNAEDVQINFSGHSFTSDVQMNPSTRINDPSTKFETRQVQAIVSNPLWTGSGDHDLALLSLVTDAPATAVPVKLLPDIYLDKAQNQTTFEGQPQQPVLLLGYGLTNEDDQTETDILRMTNVPADFEKNLVVTDQTHGTGGCNGDSGGPAFLQIDNVYYQVGVTHGPHGDSQTCHETGEWMNPALDADFLSDATKKLIP